LETIAAGVKSPPGEKKGIEQKKGAFAPLSDKLLVIEGEGGGLGGELSPG
jgi:hypothetical protein